MPIGIAIPADGRAAFVADHVMVLDLDALAPTGTLEAGREPCGLADVARGPWP